MVDGAGYGTALWLRDGRVESKEVGLALRRDVEMHIKDHAHREAV